MVDESLENVHPAVTVDGESLTVTWGSTIPNQSKGGAPKPTTYVFAAAYRDERSILASRVDRTGAEIFRFYFGSKVLFRITSNPGNTSQELPCPRQLQFTSQTVEINSVVIPCIRSSTPSLILIASDTSAPCRRPCALR